MKDLIYNSQYQNLHMDRAKPISMRTVEININSNLSSSATPRLVFEYAHGYDYTPQFWGLWDVVFMGGLGFDGNPYIRRAYGYMPHNTGFGLVASWYYTVDSTHVRLYFLFNNQTGSTITTAGTKAVFTGYLFANGRNNQDYTS